MLRLPTGVVEPETRTFKGAAGEVSLTAREVRLLVYLANRPNHTATRQELLVEVWGYSPDVRSRTVDSTVHRLRRKLERDPSTPEALVSVYGEGYRLELERSERANPVLPALYGRAALLVELEQRLETGGWLQLVGPVGVGKTSVVRAVADRMPQLQPRTVRISDLQRPADVVLRVASSIGVSTHHLTRERLARALAGRGPLLLVLDGLERIGDELVPLLEEWSATAPELRVISTSRIALAGQVLEVEPLEPTPALELLIDRARTQHPELTVFPEDTPTLEALCDALDRIPLALELAGSRLAFLGAEDLLERLSKGRSLPGLDRAIRSSWELLDEPGRKLLCWISPVPGELSLDRIEAVVGTELHGVSVLELLELLVSNSLLQVVRPTGEAPRFEMLGSVRRFCRDQLQARSDREAARRALDSAVVDEARRQVHALHTVGHQAAERALADEAALLQLVASRLPLSEPTALATVASGVRAAAYHLPLDGVLHVLTEGIRATSRAGLSDDEARLRLDRATLRRSRGVDDEVEEDLQTALSLADPGTRLHARVVHRIANRHRQQGRSDEALAAYDEARTGYAANRDVYGLVLEGIDRALLLRRRGELQAAREALMYSVGEAHRLGLRRLEARARGNLASVLRSTGEIEQAVAMSAEALEAARDVGDELAVASMLTNRGNLLLALGRSTEAAPLLEQALAGHETLGSAEGEAHALGSLAVVEVFSDRWTEAEVRWRAAARRHHQCGDPRAEAVSWACVGMARLAIGATRDAIRHLERARPALRGAHAAMVDGYLALAHLEIDPERAVDEGTGPMAQLVRWRLGTEPVDPAALERLRNDPTLRAGVLSVERHQAQRDG